MQKFVTTKAHNLFFSSPTQETRKSALVQTSFVETGDVMDCSGRPYFGSRTNLPDLAATARYSAANRMKVYAENANGERIVIGQAVDGKILIDVKGLGANNRPTMQRQSSFTIKESTVRTVEVLDESVRQGSPLPGSENSTIHNHGWNTSPILSPTVVKAASFKEQQSVRRSLEAGFRESINESFVTCSSFASLRASPEEQEENRIPDWITDSTLMSTTGRSKYSRIFLSNMPSIVIEPIGRKVELRVLSVVDPETIICSPPASCDTVFDEFASSIRRHCEKTPPNSSYIPEVLEVILCCEGRKDWFRAVVVNEVAPSQDWISVIRLDGSKRGQSFNVPKCDFRPMVPEFNSRLNVVICGLKDVRPKGFKARPRTLWSPAAINTLTGWIKGSVVEIEVLGFSDCIVRAEIFARGSNGRVLNIRKLLVKQDLAENCVPVSRY